MSISPGGAIKSLLFGGAGGQGQGQLHRRATVGATGKHISGCSETKVQGHLEKQFWKVELKMPSAPVQLYVNIEMVWAVRRRCTPLQSRRKRTAGRGHWQCVHLPTASDSDHHGQPASSNLESYTKIKPVSIRHNVKYRPYSNIASVRSLEMVVHAENNNPMLRRY